MRVITSKSPHNRARLRWVHQLSPQHTITTIRILGSYCPCQHLVRSLEASYTVGNAYDTQVNTNLGSVSTILNSIYGGTFNGQLVFNLPPSILGHPIRILVSIYDSKPLGNGNDLLLTTAAQMVRVNFSNYQNPYQSGNCYQNSYCSYPSNYCYSWSSYCYYQSYQNAYCFYRYGNYYCHYYPPNHQHRP